jgi:hypothetical protein
MGQKDAKEILTEFMSEHFGEWLGKKLLAMKLLEYGKTNINDFSEFELKQFVDIMMRTLFYKMRVPSQVKIIKLMLMNKLFGKEEAIKIAAESTYVSGVRPIEFMHELFGRFLGDKLIRLAEKSFHEVNIAKQDELKQVLFMKKVVAKLFSFDKDFESDMKLQMLIFIKRGPKRQNFLLKMMKEEQYKDKISHVYDEFVEWMEDEEEDITDVMIFLEKQKNIGLKNKEKQLDKSQIKEAVNVTLLDFLSDYMSSSEIKQFMDEEKTRLEIDEIAFAEKKKKQKFIDDFLCLNVINQFSIQRTCNQTESLKV